MISSEKNAFATRPSPRPLSVVLLLARRHSVNQVTYQVLFVALHEDLYWTDWVVHEGETAPFSQSYLEQLEALSCHLDIP